MALKKHIDEVLKHWPYDASQLAVRIVSGKDSRDVIQMRIDMGILQLETTGRPDGTMPEGSDTYYDHLVSQAADQGEELVMSEDHCNEADREFVQYYHRRVCWLTLREFPRAVDDAQHTLALMDFCRKHSPDEEWTMSHEQYRPFVLFHRTQAAALASLESSGAESAIQELNDGLDDFRNVFREYDAEEQMEDDELVQRLIEMRESLREQFEIGRTLAEQLNDAVESEQYELAAQLRDQLARRTDGKH